MESQPSTLSDGMHVYSYSYEDSYILPLLSKSNYGTEIRELGEGGFGRVYATDKGFAIKEIKTPDNQEFPDSGLLKEIAATKRLIHPYIMRIEDVFFSGGNIYTVSEIAMKDTFSLIPEQNLLIITYRFLCAVSYLHSLQMIHRDIKPENVLLISPTHPKLTDFGLVDLYNCKTSPDRRLGLNGTLQYLSIELLLSDITNMKVTSAIDVWSSACTIYEWYSTKNLFDANHLDELIYQIIDKFGYPGAKMHHWSDFKNYPGAVEYAHLRNKRGKRKAFVLDISTTIEGNAIAMLCLRMFTYNPVLRPTAYEILQDPVFDAIREKNNEFDFPPCGVSAIKRDRYAIIDIKDLPIDPKVYIKSLIDVGNIAILNDYHPRTLIMAIKYADETIYQINPGKDINLFTSACLSLAVDIFDTQKYVSTDLLTYGLLKDYDVVNVEGMRVNILTHINFDLDFSSAYDYKYALKDLGLSKEEIWEIVGLLVISHFTNIRYNLLPHKHFQLCTETVLKSMGKSTFNFTDEETNYLIEKIQDVADTRVKVIYEYYTKGLTLANRLRHYYV